MCVGYAKAGTDVVVSACKYAKADTYVVVNACKYAKADTVKYAIDNVWKVC